MSLQIYRRGLLQAYVFKNQLNISFRLDFYIFRTLPNLVQSCTLYTLKNRTLSAMFMIISALKQFLGLKCFYRQGLLEVHLKPVNVWVNLTSLFNESNASIKFTCAVIVSLVALYRSRLIFTHIKRCNIVCTALM